MILKFILFRLLEKYLLYNEELSETLIMYQEKSHPAANTIYTTKFLKYSIFIVCEIKKNLLCNVLSFYFIYFQNIFHNTGHTF